MIAIAEMYKVPFSVYLPEGKFTQPPLIIVCQVMTEKSISFFSGKLRNGRKGALLPVTETEGLDILTKFVSVDSPLIKTFSLNISIA
jgi:hypothetical protein